MGGTASKAVESPDVHEHQAKIQKYVDGVEEDGAISDADGEEDEVDECASNCLDYCKFACDTDPTKMREAYNASHPVVLAADQAALEIDPANFKYPFENIVLEGGGNKGLAYVGCIKCFEDLGIMSQIKRIGGTSAGAITAALIAFGYTSEEVLTFLSDDIEAVFLDHSCGYLSLIPNMLNNFGWNPGKKIHEWFGNAIQRKTGDPDTTFRQLYKSTGMELCVVITNLNLKSAQYCHAKTTPDMSIRDALRMTMSIPGVFSAIPLENHGQTDLIVDGGVLVNYPINCYDGWYLSMDKEDSFLLKFKSLKNLNALMSPANRFQARGPNKTVGFLLFADSETEIMRFNLEKRIGTLCPEKPKSDTELYLNKMEKKKIKIRTEKEHVKVVEAVESFLAVLHKNNIYDQEYIDRGELQAALNDENFSEKQRRILFGKDSNLDKAFELLDADGNGKVSCFELMQFMAERGIRMQVRVQGYGRKEVNTLPSFLIALQDTLLTNLKVLAMTSNDEDRTVGINTGHVGTSDYVLAEDDREFVVQRGYNATMSFLRYYAAKHPDHVKKGTASVKDQQPKSIHS